MEAAAALTDMYDQALLGILQHVGNVEEFLRVLFGFLYRKTDFYRLLLRPGDRLGFPPGAAQAMALQVPLGGSRGRGTRRAVAVTGGGCPAGGPGVVAGFQRCLFPPCPRGWRVFGSGTARSGSRGRTGESGNESRVTSPLPCDGTRGLGDGQGL